MNNRIVFGIVAVTVLGSIAITPVLAGPFSRGKAEEIMQQKFAEMDADHNGAISETEFQTAMMARFHRMDGNGDDQVTLDEMKAAAEQMKAQYQ